MKKLFLFAAALAILTGFSSLMISCGSSNSPSSPAATPTPTPIPVVYIYKVDTVSATNYQNLLNANGYNCATVLLINAGSINFADYNAILIADDTASGAWGNASVVTAIKNSLKPVLGIGAGGAYFFDTAGDPSIGAGNCATNSSTSINAVNTTNSLWSNPNLISTSGSIALYTAASTNFEEYISGPLSAGTTLFGQDASYTAYYPQVSYTSGSLTYFLWGYQSDPSAMTTAGKNLFINMMKNL